MTESSNKWLFQNRKITNYFSPESVEFTDENNTITFSDHVEDSPELKSWLDKFRRAAVIHRVVRKNAADKMKDGVKYWDVVESVESDILKYTKCGTRETYFPDPSLFDKGIAFPVGFSVNEIAAHDSSYVDDERVLIKGDVVKVDIGILYEGAIIDSAFTHIVDEPSSVYNPLVDATKDATYSAIAMAGVDVRLYEMSEMIQEILESYEVDDGKNVIKLSAIRALGGHDILPNKVHGDKLILCVPNEVQENMKMSANEIYAIETYASTGFGEVTQKGDITHFSYEKTPKFDKILSKGKTQFDKWLLKRGELPFNSNWCEDAKISSNSDMRLRKFIGEGFILAYPPLTDELYTKTAQTEHTLYVGEKGTEIFSLGNDY